MVDLNRLNIMNSNAIKQFQSLKGIVNNNQNDALTISKAQKDIDFIVDQLINKNPDENGIMEKIDFLETVGGIQSYIEAFKEIIFDHLETIRKF